MRRNDLLSAIAWSSLIGLAACNGMMEPAGSDDAEDVSEGITEEGAAPRALRAIEKIDRQALPPGADWEASAERYARRQLGLEDALDREGLTFRVLGGGTTPEGVRFVRLAQRYRGIPIAGADVVVVGDAAAFSSLHGNAVTSPAQLGDLEAQRAARTLDGEQALKIAFQRYLGKVTDHTAALTASRQQAELVIAPETKRGPTLAYRTSLFTDQQGGVEPGLWITFVDAITGDVIEEHNALHALSQASGPGGNPNVVRSWVNALDVEPFGGSRTVFQMSTTRLQTWNMRLRPPAIVTGPLSPIGDAAINDAHGFAEISLDHLLAWYNENSINGAGLKIISRVHYGTNYAGAFWDGAQMTYGDGDGVFIYAPQGSIDIVTHELSHGYTTYHANLTFSGQSGGVSESFSDIAGEAAEAYYKNAAPDFVVGADILVGGGFIRDLCTPTADGASIDHISSYTAGLDVHYSSGIMNKAFCRTARRLASNSPTGAATLASVRRASTAWFRANKVYWTSGTTFQQACAGVFAAASELGFTAYEKWALRQSWIDVGITCGTATSPVTFAIDQLTGLEADSAIIFSVTKVNSDGLSHAVTYATANGSATAGGDYTAFTGTLTFAPADTVRLITVAITDDAIPEPTETFSVNLSGLTNGGTLVTPQGIGTILDDD